MIVFVYGTLKRGNYLSSVLDRSEYLGESQTVSDGFRMFCIGAYPYVTRAQEGYQISGELYQVDFEILARLDQIEQHPYHYVRTVERFEHNGVEVEGEMYLIPYDDDLLLMTEIHTGEWVAPIQYIFPETLGGHLIIICWLEHLDMTGRNQLAILRHHVW